jgi:hypothetical protein
MGLLILFIARADGADHFIEILPLNYNQGPAMFPSRINEQTNIPKGGAEVGA